MTEATERLAQGWWFALNSRKAHYYEKGEIRSICGKQMTFGSRPGTEDDNHDSADNCAACKRQLPAVQVVK